MFCHCMDWDAVCFDVQCVILLIEIFKVLLNNASGDRYYNQVGRLQTAQQFGLSFRSNISDHYFCSLSGIWHGDLFCRFARYLL
jgi:hypothetical protein